MELEKELTVAAPRQRVWALLLDPTVMAGCVPGTQSVAVISDVAYEAEIKVKISFIAARFKIRTTIVDQQPPHYLRIEGTGEDRSVASAMRQTSELFLTEIDGGSTRIRIKAKAEVLGRLGSFGLSVMRTKADRMWDEFGANFAAVAERNAASAMEAPMEAHMEAPREAPSPVPEQPPAIVNPAPAPENVVLEPPPPGDGKMRWWRRRAGPQAAPSMGERRLPSDIYIEIHRPNGVVKVLWPSSAAGEAARWLQGLD